MRGIKYNTLAGSGTSATQDLSQCVDESWLYVSSLTAMGDVDGTAPLFSDSSCSISGYCPTLLTDGIDVGSSAMFTSMPEAPNEVNTDSVDPTPLPGGALENIGAMAWSAWALDWIPFVTSG